MRSYDLSHLPLLLVTLAPLAAAVVAGAITNPNEPLDLDVPGAMSALSTVIGLVALGAMIEVIGHEIVGYKHTLAAWQKDARTHVAEVARS